MLEKTNRMEGCIPNYVYITFFKLIIRLLPFSHGSKVICGNLVPEHYLYFKESDNTVGLNHCVH